MVHPHDDIVRRGALYRINATKEKWHHKYVFELHYFFLSPDSFKLLVQHDERARGIEPNPSNDDVTSNLLLDSLNDRGHARFSLGPDISAALLVKVGPRIVNRDWTEN